jgi:hypothetical protein
MSKHSISEGHCFNFKAAKALVRTAGYMDHIVKEAIEIQLHPDNFNSDMGFTL